MRIAVGWIVLALGACTYDDPGLVRGFKCDAEHGCPASQSCVAGLCTGGGGLDGPPSTANGVKCGAAGVCPVGQACCASPVAAPTCQPSAASCGGTGLTATCDGNEDCDATSDCCQSGAGTAACGAAGCPNRVCTSNTDCPGSTCCFDVGFVPWGRCGFC